MSNEAKQPDMDVFATGAKRFPVAERFDLMPFKGLIALSRVCAEGAARYGEHNWRLGIPQSNLLNHAFRHLVLYLSGDRSEDHLAKVAWNALVAKEMEDREDMCDLFFVEQGVEQGNGGKQTKNQEKKH